MIRRLAYTALAASMQIACIRAPSPLTPGREGSIGLPSHGVLTHGVELPPAGHGFHFLRHNDRHFATPRAATLVKQVAAEVEQQRPGSVLVLGDFSKRHGGFMLPHLSHRSGRDSDLVLYLTTLDGKSVPSPEFLHVESDGLAWDAQGRRFLRFDVEREWLLVKALLSHPDARVQWLFAGHNIEALLLAWAKARGERPELIANAAEILLEPHPGGPHDDHLHMRVACTDEEEAAGCESSGPTRSFWTPPSQLSIGPSQASAPTNAELARALLTSLDPIASR